MIFGGLIVCVSFLIHTISGSALHGPCTSNQECGTLDTMCSDNTHTCVCRENFAVKEDTCVHLATPRIHCKSRHDCKEALGARSLCTKEHLCACSPFHHLHNNQCVKNRDLDESCQHDHQCYCGADCEEKIACLFKSCSCRPGYKTYFRRCMDDPTHVAVTDPTVDVDVEVPTITVLTANTGTARHLYSTEALYFFVLSTVLL